MSKEQTLEEEIHGACAVHVNNLSRRGAHIFLVCVDGSENGDVALQSIVNTRKKYDFVCIYHCFKAEANEQDILRAKYEDFMSQFISDKDYCLYWEDRAGRSVYDTLTSSLFRDYSENTLAQCLPLGKLPDFIVMGQHGRKARMKDSYSIGSNSDLALRHLRIPCIVIKNLIEKRRQKIIMAVNESHKSRVGMDIVYRLITTRDILICIFVATSDMDQQTIQRVREYYECDMMDFGPTDSQFVVLHSSVEGVKDAIVNYVNQSDADLFAVAPRSKHTPSSISDHLIKQTRKSILVCKI